jgi:DNA-binding GntR family transcriptional regulator
MRNEYEQSRDEDAPEREDTGLVHKSLVSAVTEALAREIQTGRIKPGARIMPAEVAKRLDVSQTPVREAMRTLETRGLIVVERRVTFASSLSVDNVREIYALRRIIECDAAREAVRAQTPKDIQRAQHAWTALQKTAGDPYSERFWRSHREFHWSIYRSPNKSDWTRRVLNVLWGEVERYVTISINTHGAFADIQDFAAAMVEHERMLKCFVDGDEAGLVAVVEQHLKRTAGDVEGSVADRTLGSSAT